MSEKISLHDLVAIEAMSAIIAKAAGADARPRAAALGAFDYADAFMAVRDERSQSAEVKSLGAELRMLREQRDLALTWVRTLRDDLEPLYRNFEASFEPHPVPQSDLGGVNIRAGMSRPDFRKVLQTLRKLQEDAK